MLIPITSAPAVTKPYNNLLLVSPFCAFYSHYAYLYSCKYSAFTIQAVKKGNASQRPKNYLSETPEKNSVRLQFVAIRGAKSSCRDSGNGKKIAGTNVQKFLKMGTNYLFLVVFCS